MLSAQTTDRRVNAVRPTLFAAYPDAQAMAAADREHLEQIIGPLGFFRAKTDSLLKLSAALVERYDGQVPPRLDDLVTLPGVGRKTANVVLGNAFGIPGITVDTHFGRLARRFGWTDETDPVKVEHAVGALFEKRDWVMLCHHLIWHGRRMLPRQEARVRCLPGRAHLPVVRRGAGRPGRRGREAGEDRGSGVSAAASCLRARGACCSCASPAAPGPPNEPLAQARVDVDTPQLWRSRSRPASTDCPKVGLDPVRRRHARVTLRVSAGVAVSTWPACAARRS